MHFRYCKDCQDAAGQQLCWKEEPEARAGARGSNLLLTRASPAVAKHRHPHHLLADI